MQESKTGDKSLWWNGASGGMTFDKKYKIYWVKPHLVGIPKDYTEIYYNPHLTAPKANMYVLNGNETQLSEVQKDTLDALITAAFPSGGGGGGSDPQAITNIMPDGIKPNLVFQRADGTRSTVPLKANIQNTPAFSLAVQVKADPTKWNHHNNPNAGVQYTNPNDIFFLPPTMWDLGGEQKGVTFNKNDGTFFLHADNLSVNLMIRMIACMDKNSVHYKDGLPHGDYGMSIVLQRLESGNWVTKVDKMYLAMSLGADGQYPNTQQPCCGIYNKGFSASLAEGGTYRVGLRGHFGTDPKYWPHWKMFYSAWEPSADPAYWHFQMTGSIKDVSPNEVIPPVDKP